jgi:sulfur carrier protein
MKANVNGVEREISEGATVESLLVDLGATLCGLAVALNGRVVRQAEHAGATLAEGDTVEIVRAVAGG